MGSSGVDWWAPDPEALGPMYDNNNVDVEVPLHSLRTAVWGENQCIVASFTFLDDF